MFVKLTTHLHLVVRLRMYGTIYPLNVRLHGVKRDTSNFILHIKTLNKRTTYIMPIYATGQHYVAWLTVAERMYGYTVYQLPSVAIKESAVVLIGCKTASAHLTVRQHNVSPRSTQLNFTHSNSHSPLYWPPLTKQTRSLHYVIPSSHM
jgi:hypothetical protein